MVTAEQLRQEFMDHMDKLGVRYTVMDDEDNIVYLSFGGDTETFVIVDFDESNDGDANSVCFVSQGFAQVKQANVPAALVKLNEVNGRYRWVKFFMRENQLTAIFDAKVYPGSVGDECTEMAVRMSNNIERALKDFEGIAVVDDDAKWAFDMMAAMKHMSGK